jgi:hypothetical protein
MLGLQSQDYLLNPSLLPGEVMKFYIEYEGRIPSANAKDKEARRLETHIIRKCFHSQLLRLWDARFGSVAGLPPKGNPLRMEERRKYLQEKSLPIAGTEFIVRPLITKSDNLICALDITLFRHEPPGELIGPGGDLDNKIKSLFDALTVPNQAQLDGIEPREGERPLFCLLENDALITDLRINTVQLWTTFNSTEEKRDIKAAVNVTVLRTEFAGWGVAALPDA